MAPIVSPVLRVVERAEAERAVAREIADLVRSRGGEVVLGLATGRTPVGVYRELVRMQREEELDLFGVRTFNLDEYCGLAPGDPRSFRAFMDRHLFAPIGLDRDRTHFPATEGGPGELERGCAEYERAIEAAGGIDLQILGLGRNGHIGFNEPGSDRATRTRRVELEARTREDAAAEFGGLGAVPGHAVTVGVATILAARRIRTLAFGAGKAEVVARAVEGTIGPDLPASYLREHADAVLYVDRAAASALAAE